MPSAFELGTAQKIREVMAIKTRRAVEDRLGLKLLPVTDRNESDLNYERHRLLRGIQGPRGMGGPTSAIQRPGTDAFRVSPGYYGDHYLINENDLINRRQVGSWDQFDTDGKQTSLAASYLDQRYYDRIEKNTFDLLTTGGYEVTDADGRVYFRDVYDLKTAAPGTGFDNLSASQPMAFFLDTIEALERGTSVDFSNGQLIMNQTTANTILKNTNTSDLGGKRATYGSTLNTVKGINDEIFKANGIPPIEVYNEGFYPEPEGTAFSRFIPTGKAILLGRRKDGEQIGEYTQTRAAQNKDSGPGMWLTVRDERDRSQARIIIECGHNGGPKVFYPEAICVLTLYAP